MARVHEARVLYFNLKLILIVHCLFLVFSGPDTRWCLDIVRKVIPTDVSRRCQI